MNGTLILSGGGDLRESFVLDERFFSFLKNNSKILYIPIALKRDAAGFEACYDWFSGIISAHAKEKEIDFTMILEKDIIPDLKLYDCVYIGGGNTFKLLDYIVRNDLKGRLVDYLNSGGIVYGGSAGAIILGKDIRTVEEENDNDYSFYEGFNFLDGYSLICHYEEAMDSGIFESVKKIENNVLALTESSGIILSNNSVEIIGEVFEFGVDGVKERIGKL